MALTQKSIEAFFKQYKVTNPDKKMKILPEVTDIIYDYNMLVVKYEKEKDAYKKKQILTDIKEEEEKIAKVFNSKK